MLFLGLILGYLISRFIFSPSQPLPDVDQSTILKEIQMKQSELVDVLKGLKDKVGVVAKKVDDLIAKGNDVTPEVLAAVTDVSNDLDAVVAK